MSKIRIRKGVSKEEGVVSDADDKVRRIKEDRLTTADLAGAGREQQKVDPRGGAASEGVTHRREEKQAREEGRTQERRTTSETPSSTSSPEQGRQVAQGAPAGSAAG